MFPFLENIRFYKTYRLYTLLSNSGGTSPLSMFPVKYLITRWKNLYWIVLFQTTSAPLSFQQKKILKTESKDRIRIENAYMNCALGKFLKLCGIAPLKLLKLRSLQKVYLIWLENKTQYYYEKSSYYCILSLFFKDLFFFLFHFFGS